MRHYLTLFAAFFLVLSSIGHVEAKRRGSSSFSRSRSTRPAPRKTYSKPKPRPVKKHTSIRKTKSSFGKKKLEKAAPTKKATVTKTNTKKPKATAPSKLSKNMQKKNAAATKKYGTGKAGRKNAAKDYRTQKAASVQKKWDREPATRPNYVPNTVSYGGRDVNVVFHGGGYGYYAGSVWTPLDYAVHMVVTDAMLMNHGYGYYGTYHGYTPTRVIHHQVVADPEAQRINARTGQIFLFFILGIVGIVVVVIAVKMFKN